MRAHLEAWLQSRWYGRNRPPWLLRQLSRVQAGLVRLNQRRRQGAWHAPVPVVVIGNLTLGGTGKTPFVIWLATRLREMGLRVGIVSRGYGRRRHDVRPVEEGSDWREVGDEPLLIHRMTACPVVVGRDRVAASRMLIDRHRPDIILCDDGLQHYRLGRDVEVAVIDGGRRFGNGWLFPAGPLREPLSRLEDVTFRVWNGGTPPEESGIGMQLLVEEAVALASGERRPLKLFAPGPVQAVAGIGSPQRFFDTLRARGIEVIPIEPGDHQPWQPSARDEGIPVLMTDKDAVKLPVCEGRPWWRVPVQAQVSHAEELLDQLRALTMTAG